MRVTHWLFSFVFCLLVFAQLRLRRPYKRPSAVSFSLVSAATELVKGGGYES